MHFFKHIRIIVICLTLSVLFSCIKEFKDVPDAQLNISPEFGLPIANIVLTLTDTLSFEANDPQGIPSIQLYPGDDGILQLQVSQTLDTLTLDSILAYLITDTITKRIDLPFPNGFYIKGETELGISLEKITEGKKIDSLKMDNGTLSICFNTFQYFDSELSLSFPNITDKQNNILEINNFKPSEDDYSVDIDLKEHKLKIDNKDGKGYMVVKLNYFIDSKDDEEKVDTPNLDIFLNNLDIDYAYGSFGYDTVQNINPFVVPLFDEKVKNPFKGQEITFDFEDPEINLNVLNGFGIPLKYVFKQFDVFNNGVSSRVSGVPKSILINAPPESFPNEYSPAVFSLDPSTNIDLLLSKFPDYLKIDGTLFMNPENPDAKNYINDDDILTANLDVIIPFRLRITEVNLTDTIKFDLEEYPEIKYAELLKLKTEITNSFPFELNIQAYFVTGNFEKIDSLFDVPINIKGSDNPTDPKTELFYDDKNHDQILELLQVKNIIVQAGFKTNNSDEGMIVNFHKDHKLKMSFIGFTKINL